LRVKEVNELVAILKEEHCIEPAAAVAQMVVAGAATETGNTAVAEEKSSFNVVLKSAGASKLAVVKLVKELTGLGLKEAKQLVDNAPNTIKEGINKAEAESIKES